MADALQVIYLMKNRKENNDKRKLEKENAFINIKMPNSRNIFNNIKTNQLDNRKKISKEKFLKTVAKQKTENKSRFNTLKKCKKEFNLAVPMVNFPQNENLLLDGLKIMRFDKLDSKLERKIRKVEKIEIQEETKKFKYKDPYSTTFNKDLSLGFSKIMLAVLRTFSSIEVHSTRGFNLFTSKDVLAPYYLNMPKINIDEIKRYLNLKNINNGNELVPFTSNNWISHEHFTKSLKYYLCHNNIVNFTNSELLKIYIPESSNFFKNKFKTIEISFPKNVNSVNRLKYLPFVIFPNPTYEKILKNVSDYYEKFIKDNNKLILKYNNGTVNLLPIIPEPKDLFSKVKLTSLNTDYTTNEWFKLNEKKVTEIYDRQVENQKKFKENLTFLPLPSPSLNILKKSKKRSYNDLIKESKVRLGHFYLYDIKNYKPPENNISYYVKNIKEGVDLIFDFDSCGIILMGSEFKDLFDPYIYEDIYKIVDKAYIYFQNFYFIIIDDLAPLRATQTLPSLETVIENFTKFLNDKFKEVMNDPHFNLSFYFKTIRNYGLLGVIIDEILEEINIKNKGFMGLESYKEIIEIMNEKIVVKQEFVYFNNIYSKLNTFESFILSSLDCEGHKDLSKIVFEEINKVSYNNIFI